MNHFIFYVEFDGKRNITETFSRPSSTIIAPDIRSAAEKYATKNRLKSIECEPLDNGDYRVYFSDKKWLGRRSEYIYYVKKDENNNSRL